MQVELYPELSRLLFTFPRGRYLGAARLLETETELTKKLEGVEALNHDVLRAIYWLIADHFRIKAYTAQIPLLANERAELQKAWREFFDGQLYELTRANRFVRAVLAAVAFKDTQEGRRAERELMGCLRDYYDLDLSAYYKSGGVSRRSTAMSLAGRGR